VAETILNGRTDIADFGEVWQAAQFYLHFRLLSVRVVVDWRGVWPYCPAPFSLFAIRDSNFDLDVLIMAKRAPKKSADNARKSSAKAMQKTVSLKHVFPDDLRSIFANVFAVQGDGPDFRLLFFQARPPLIIPEAPGSREAFEQLKEIPALCVAEIVVSAARIQSIIDTLSANFTLWQEQQAAQLVAGRETAVEKGNNHVK
jgi:hypothetical protein